MKTYQHTQRGTLILIAMAIVSAVAALGGLALRPVTVAVPLLLLAAWLFHSLTIEIADGVNVKVQRHSITAVLPKDTIKHA